MEKELKKEDYIKDIENLRFFLIHLLIWKCVPLNIKKDVEDLCNRIQEKYQIEGL